MKRTSALCFALLLILAAVTDVARLPAGEVLVLAESPTRNVDQKTATRIEKMEKVADHALVPPVLNTSPLPEYDYENLDYA